MKRIPSAEDQVKFHLSGHERRVLIEVLKNYPCVPVSYPRLSHTAQHLDAEANQHLLEEALAEQRAENKRPRSPKANSKRTCHRLQRPRS